MPIVPAAILFDLWVGDARIRPDAARRLRGLRGGERAHAPAQGNVGAGAGATVGKLFGIERAMKGGIGSASVTVGGITVGALVAVNALGDVIDPATGAADRRRAHAPTARRCSARMARAAARRTARAAAARQRDHASA